MLKKISHLLFLFALFNFTTVANTQDIEEFKIKRENNFEFESAPTLIKKENEIQIQFTTKAYCDVSIAVEDENGKIVRHLANGVLGERAPLPFKKNSKSQTISWDFKNDKEEYVKDFQNHTIRVSLGLKPQFEKNLLWSPTKRTAIWNKSKAQIFASTPKGMLVYQNGAFDHIRLFDHDGNYLKTVYPFSNESVKNVDGVAMHKFPHSNTVLPLKKGFYQTSLLHGESVPLNVKRKNVSFEATGLAVSGDQIALLGNRLMNISMSGKKLAQKFEGPEISATFRATGMNADQQSHQTGPCSAAFSPDQKTLYLSGYYFRHTWCFDGMHGVQKVDLTNGTVSLFKGAMNVQDKKSDNEGFHVATSVACDAKGRVYISDFMNDRIQVFDESGKFLKTIAVKRPVKINIDPKSQEIYVFSWVIHNRSIMNNKEKEVITPQLHQLGNFDQPKIKQSFKLELPLFKGNYYEWTNELINSGPYQDAEIDFYSSPPRVWISENNSNNWDKQNIKIYSIQKDNLKLEVDFGEVTKKNMARSIPPILNRQRLYVNPKTGMLYIGEADAGVGKSFKQLIEVNPETQQSKLVDIPFDSEDMCFDIDGNAYLRTGSVLARFDSTNWKEIPWDYGTELGGVSFESSSGRRTTDLVSGIQLPGHRAHSFWHLGGMHINPLGNIIITVANPINKKPDKNVMYAKQKIDLNFSNAKYQPPIFPGRVLWGSLFIYNKHGQMVQEDAFPGIGHMNGVSLDKENNIYAMVSGYRLIDGKKYDPKLTDDLTDTLVKVPAGKSKVISTSNNASIPLTKETTLSRPKDIKGTQALGGEGWIEGAEWFYGGIGFAGKNAAWDGGGCCCWNARFAFDYFDRSFVPELRHFSVGVLDKNGNLICRIGTYGNVDDGVPLNKSKGPSNPKSIGGDEVAIFHGAFLGTDSDKRLFIADEGNNRIISVKLNYHKNIILKMKD